MRTIAHPFHIPGQIGEPTADDVERLGLIAERIAQFVTELQREADKLDDARVVLNRGAYRRAPFLASDIAAGIAEVVSNNLLSPEAARVLSEECAR
jgi:hypothetical protein